MPPSTKALNNASKILTTQKQKDNGSSPLSQKTSQTFPTQRIRNAVTKCCTEKTAKVVCHPPDYCPNYTRISNGPSADASSPVVKYFSKNTYDYKKGCVFFEEKLLENFRIAETVQRERNDSLKNITYPPTQCLYI